MSRARDLADSADLNFDDGTLVIDSGNNRVGIGTDSPTRLIHGKVNSATTDGFRFENTEGQAQLLVNDSGDVRVVRSAGHDIIFDRAGAEDMRIDSSGNLLVGKTSTTLGAEGSELRPDGQVRGIRDGGTVLLLNRLTDDGTIAAFYQNSSPAGEIGNSGANLYIQGRSGKSGLEFSGTSINPRDDLALSDGVNDLGSSTYRFKDLYLSGGVYLGGTGSANKLTDYEEGTWTLVYGDNDVGGNTNTSGVLDARYTKIGNLVYLQGRLGNIDTTGMSSGNDFFIRGLPFVSKDGSGISYVGTMWMQSATYSGQIVPRLPRNSAWFRFAEIISGAAQDWLTVGNLADDTADIEFVLIYPTDS